MLLFLLPFLGFILSFFSRFIGKKASIILTIGSVIITFLFALYVSIDIFTGKTIIYSWQWIILENMDLNFKFLLDSLSISMSLLITFITSLVMIYSSKYLEEDPSIVRFLAFFALFDVCMLLMVTSGNYIQFFLGWEGVGLTSYLLISFWHTRNEANKGALKAVVINRIGDVSFMLAIGLLWIMFKSFDFSIIFSLYPQYIANPIPIKILYLQTTVDNILALCLLIAASAKSAQFLLHTWLPDAMEGPTPVSSLLHSATMVTAGIFLIIRSSFIFGLSPKTSFIMTILGIMTALVSGLMAMSQYDLKRIIAYSTCSQLGFMAFACGLGFYHYALFHLITHAFFKCLLFLCSGSIIHATNDEQDIRKYGGLFFYLPITFTTMTIGTLALTGFPFLAGYYSKDLIIETAYTSANGGIFIWLTASFAAFLTSFYSLRSLYLVFFGKTPAISKNAVPNIHESTIRMTGPMITLTILAIFAGYLSKDFFTGPTGLLIWQNSINIPTQSSLLDHEYLTLLTKLTPTALGILGIITGYAFLKSTWSYKANLSFYSFFNLTTQKFYVDHIYNILIAKATTTLGYIQYTIIDRGYLEKIGPYGLTNLISAIQNRINMQTGFIIHYLLFIFSSLTLMFLAKIFNLTWSILCVILILTLIT